MTNAHAFAALADPTRREVFERLARRPQAVGHLARGRQAWRVFGGGLDRWWPKPLYMGDSPLKTAVVGPGVGGRWYGLHEDGGERLWGEVLAWEPPTRLLLAWRISAEWAYDPNLLTEVEVRFTALPSGETRVDFEHRGLERLGDSD